MPNLCFYCEKSGPDEFYRLVSDPPMHLGPFFRLGQSFEVDYQVEFSGSIRLGKDWIPLMNRSANLQNVEAIAREMIRICYDMYNYDSRLKLSKYNFCLEKATSKVKIVPCQLKRHKIPFPSFNPQAELIQLIAVLLFQLLVDATCEQITDENIQEVFEKIDNKTPHHSFHYTIKEMLNPNCKFQVVPELWLLEVQRLKRQKHKERAMRRDRGDEKRSERKLQSVCKLELKARQNNQKKENKLQKTHKKHWNLINFNRMINRIDTAFELLDQKKRQLSRASITSLRVAKNNQSTNSEFKHMTFGKLASVDCRQSIHSQKSRPEVPSFDRLVDVQDENLEKAYEQYYWLIEQAFEAASQLKQSKKVWMVPCFLLQRNMHLKRKALCKSCSNEMQAQWQSIIKFGQMIKTNGLFIQHYLNCQASLTNLQLVDYKRDGLAVMAKHSLQWVGAITNLREEEGKCKLAYAFYYLSSLLLLLHESDRLVFDELVFEKKHEQLLSVKFNVNLGLEMLEDLCEQVRHFIN